MWSFILVIVGIVFGITSNVCAIASYQCIKDGVPTSSKIGLFLTAVTAIPSAASFFFAGVIA